MVVSSFFFFNDTATTEIYTLSLHDALPICSVVALPPRSGVWFARPSSRCSTDRKSTRLNSSHPSISYAVFCLKKKKSHAERHFAGEQRSLELLRRPELPQNTYVRY